MANDSLLISSLFLLAITADVVEARKGHVQVQAVSPLTNGYLIRTCVISHHRTHSSVRFPLAGKT